MWFENETVEEMRKLSFHKGKDAYSNDSIVESFDPSYKRATTIVGTLLDVWLKHRCFAFKQEVKGTCPHDALTTIEALYPGNFLNYVQGHLIVDESNGNTCFIYDPAKGTTFVSIGWKEKSGSRFMEMLSYGMIHLIDKKKLEDFIL
jgi:hypothetical protein